MNLYLLVLFWLLVSIVAYSNVVYSLILALFGTLYRQTPDSNSKNHDGLQPITLLVPAYNESAVIEAKLKNINALEYPTGMLRVLVASDGSDDGTQDIVRAFACSRPTKLLDFPVRRGKASIVNDAIEQTSDPWICLCDANVMFRPDALIRLGQRIQGSRIGAVTGNVRITSHDSDFGRGEALYYRVERAIQKGESLLGSVMGVDGGMYLLKRELFKPVDKDTILDDFTISMNVIHQGYRIQYEPSAIADENGTPSSEIEYGRRKRVARGAVQSILQGNFPSPLGQPIEFIQWFSHKLLRWLNPLLLVSIFILTVLIAPKSVYFQVLFVIEFLTLVLAILAWCAPALRDKPIIGVIYYFGLSHWAMLVGLFQGLTGKYSAIWNRTERKPITRTQ
jgi:cellulose synthase/poly-beta-1,6-N-acetylglucosamine synthase-like glycosyltransferase